MILTYCEPISSVVASLCLPAPSFVTGVDGGMVRQWLLHGL